ncbi:unnamed protein product [Ectocarpus sp. CCAP 1310/34]|nr:unnamed protein product [Ectocarpus sp. CCAP 1310/34]
MLCSSIERSPLINPVDVKKFPVKSIMYNRGMIYDGEFEQEEDTSDLGES